MARGLDDRRSAGRLGSTEPGAIYLGRYWDWERQQVGEKLYMGGTQPIVVVGRNRSGKDARLGTYNFLENRGKSWVIVDPRGEAGAISAPYRRTLGPTYMVNAFGVLTGIPGYEDLRSDGCNPLTGITDGPRLFEDCCGVGEAAIKIEGKDPHWSQSAQSLFIGETMSEVRTAAREKRAPSLARVRHALTEADERDPDTDELVKGLAVRADRLVREGGPQIASLMGRFSRDNEEIHNIQSSADAQTRWLLSGAIAADMAKGTLDFRKLGDRPGTAYICLPHEMVETFGLYLRLLISAALRGLYRPHPVTVAFWLNEFAALGRLQPIEAALGLVAGFGIQLVVVLQSLTQLKLHYEEGWENFLGQAGAVVCVGPPADLFTAEWFSKRAGEMTVRQPTANTNFTPGSPPGFGMGEGFGRRNYLMPQDLFGMREGFGLVFCAGLARPIPIYLPAYWEVDALNRRARRNPYYRGGS